MSIWQLIFGSNSADKFLAESRKYRLDQAEIELLHAKAEAENLAARVMELSHQLSRADGVIKSKGMSEETYQARCDAYEREAVKLRSEKDEAYRVAGLSVKETETYRDAVKMLVERGGISPIEVAQLNLGRYVPGVEGLPPTVEFETPTHGKSAVDFGMKSQATEAKFRQVKHHFQQYQGAVKTILDGLNGLCKKNIVTTEDLRKVRKLRQDLSDILGRSI